MTSNEQLLFPCCTNMTQFVGVLVRNVMFWFMCPTQVSGTDAGGCNYLSLPLIPASGTQARVLICVVCISHPDPIQQSYTISSEAWNLASGATASYSAVVDATLGRDTEITFDYGQADGISIALRSPSGVAYDENSDECTLDTTYLTIKCFFPGLSEVRMTGHIALGEIFLDWGMDK